MQIVIALLMLVAPGTCKAIRRAEIDCLFKIFLLYWYCCPLLL